MKRPILRSGFNYSLMKMFNTVSSLEEALSLFNVNTPEQFDSAFDELAASLFNNFAIRRGQIVYRFVEIEFYHNLVDDMNGKTIPRTTSAGEWFFHNYGVDIAFESNLNRYGGILIRSIVEGESYKDGKTYTNGPQKAFWEIFDKLNSLHDNCEYPLIVESASDVLIEPVKSLRWPFGGNKKLRYSITAEYWKDHKNYKPFPTEE